MNNTTVPQIAQGEIENTMGRVENIFIYFFTFNLRKSDNYY